MSSHFYKDQLYPLQDSVLKVIADISTPFYLTGGTVVGRYLLNHRYSDDLDFFVNAIPNFRVEVNKIIDALKSRFEISQDNFQDSFARYFVNANGIKLKLEFVNDVGFRVGKPSLHHAIGFKFDTWENILSNKLTALSREAGKDFSDILFMSFRYPFNWKTVIDYAKQKDTWISEINASQQLHNFTLTKLDDVKFIETIDMKAITNDFFKTLARESLHGFDNSLYGTKL